MHAFLHVVVYHALHALSCHQDYRNLLFQYLYRDQLIQLLLSLNLHEISLPLKRLSAYSAYGET